MALQLRNKGLQDVIQTTRGRTYTVLIVTIIVIVLMFAVAIAPAYLSITNQIKNNDEKRDYLSELEEKETNLRTLAEQELTYTDQIAKLNQYYADQENDEFILANLNSIADNYNVVLSSVSFNNSAKSLPLSALVFPNLTRVQIAIGIQGELANMQLFLAALESFPSTITINTINYGINEEESLSAEERESLPPYAMTLTAEYFFWAYLNE